VKLGEIADRIHAHLKRFENDPVINAPVGLRKPYYSAGARMRGAYCQVHYVSYGGKGTMLTKNEAAKYLAWLDAGNIGPHWRMSQPSPASQPERPSEKK
jgi:hypothetical protein